ncbi:hypothetical protein [Wolbachia endosymbiont (group A) of Scambus nigricans]|uniref:hypothetical protein n=1 Tax=Wolbachia endosymbiont (group A) of Scambus nigricans TaxID=2954055 RepID=UPI003877B696
MVESFSGNNKGSNFIEKAKIMENFSDNNGNGSSIFQGKIREQDFSAEQKLNELKAAIEELTRQDLLRRLECERQASSCVDEISSQADLHIGEGDDEDYFTSEKGRVIGDFWNFFESLFNLFEVDVDDPKIYQMLKEKKEKNLIAAIMKFLCDKLKELIKKIFARDLSFNQRLDKEVKELQEKLGSGELSEEEFARALERLTALQDLKLRLQMAVVGWIVTMFAEMFGVELAAAVEASTEKEDKKAEKTSLKEENKEVCENVEMKVDEREKPKVPVFLFDVSPGFVRPVVLSKPELDLLPKPIMPPIFKEVINNENREVKETKPKVEEEKKAKQEEPKKEVCPPKPAEKEPVVRGKIADFISIGASTGRSRDASESANGRGTTSADKSSSISGKESKSTDEHKTDDPFAKLREKVAQRNTQADVKHDYPIGHFQVSSGTTDNGKSSADQRSSASDAKENPKSKFTDVLEEPAARGNGNTPLR